jgi:hypothetical protein
MSDKTVGTASIEMGVDASGVKSGVSEAKQVIQEVGAVAAKAGAEASAGLGRITESSGRLTAAQERLENRVRKYAETAGLGARQLLPTKRECRG